METSRFNCLMPGDVVWVLVDDYSDASSNIFRDMQIYQVVVVFGSAFSGFGYKALNHENKHLHQPLHSGSTFLTRKEAIEYFDKYHKPYGKNRKLSFIDPPSDKGHEHVMQPLTEIRVVGYKCTCGKEERAEEDG